MQRLKEKKGDKKMFYVCNDNGIIAGFECEGNAYDFMERLLYNGEDVWITFN